MRTRTRVRRNGSAETSARSPSVARAERPTQRVRIGEKSMQLGDQEASGNVEDRRGMGMAGGLGVGGIVIAVIAYFLGFDPGTVLDVAQQVGNQRETSQERDAPKGAPADEMGQFVSKVLGSTE